MTLLKADSSDFEKMKNLRLFCFIGYKREHSSEWALEYTYNYLNVINSTVTLLSAISHFVMSLVKILGIKRAHEADTLLQCFVRFV